MFGRETWPIQDEPVIQGVPTPTGAWEPRHHIVSFVAPGTWDFEGQRNDTILGCTANIRVVDRSFDTGFIDSLGLHLVYVGNVGRVLWIAEEYLGEEPPQASEAHPLGLLPGPHYAFASSTIRLPWMDRPSRFSGFTCAM